MNKILSLSLLLAVFSFSQSVEEIINRIEKNQAKIIDLEAEVEIETSIQGRPEPLIQTMKLWQGKDEKGNPITRTEFMIQDTGYTMQDKKVIMIMTNDSVFFKKGKTVSRLPLTAQMGVDKKGPQIGTDIFKDAKSVKVLSRERNIAVLEVVPRDTEGVRIFNKAEIMVDTERGVITNQKLFTPMGVIKTEILYEKLKDKETGGQGVWVLKEMKTITQYGITTMRYKNIKINKGIDKQMFEL